MSDRRINLILSAVDTGSPVVSRFAANVRRNAKDVSDANKAIYGPPVAPRFSAAESDVRDRVAGRLKAIHDGHLREQREAIVHNEVLKRTAREVAPEEIDTSGPRFGPARAPRFDAASAAQRAADAAMSREIRADANRQIGTSARRRALLGNTDLERNGFAGRDFLKGASEGGPRGAARLGEAEAGLYKRIKENTDGLEKSLKVIRGIGAAGALVEAAKIVGEGLQRLPEVTVEYREAMKKGASGTEFWSQKLADTLPGIGDLARGFRAVFDAGQYVAQKAKDDYNQRRAEVDATLDKGRKREQDRRSVVNPILDASGNAAIGATANRRLFMTRGDDRARVEAQLAYEAEVRQIGHDTLSGPNLTESEQAAARKLSPDGRDREKLNQQRDARLADAERKRTEAMYNIDRGAGRRQTEQEQSQQDRLFQIKSDGLARDLQLSGYGVSARLAALRDENAQAIRELGRRYAEETRDLTDGSQEKIAAERRYREELAALQNKGFGDEAAERERARREDAAAERSFARDIEGTRAQTIADRLRAAGAGNEADKVVQAESHRQRLKDIDEQEKEAMEKRGEWYARNGKAQFDAQRAAENESYAASVDAAGADRLRQNLPSFTTNLTSGFGLSGAVSAGALDAAREAASHQQKALAEIAKLSQGTKKTLEDILATLKSGGVQLVVLKPS